MAKILKFPTQVDFEIKKEVSYLCMPVFLLVGFVAWIGLGIFGLLYTIKYLIFIPIRLFIDIRRALLKSDSHH